MLNLLDSVITIQTDHRTELEEAEEQIIGKLFRDLIQFEGRTAEPKTFHQIKNLIDRAEYECHTVGSNCQFLDRFLKRLNLGTNHETIYLRRTL